MHGAGGGGGEAVELESGAARCWKHWREGDGLSGLSNGGRSCEPHRTAHGCKSKHFSAYWLQEGFSALRTSEADGTSKALKVG